MTDEQSLLLPPSEMDLDLQERYARTASVEHREVMNSHDARLSRRDWLAGGFAACAVIIWGLSLSLDAPSGLLLGHLAAVVALLHRFSGRHYEVTATNIAGQAEMLNVLNLRVAKALADLADIQERIDRTPLG